MKGVPLTCRNCSRVQRKSCRASMIRPADPPAPWCWRRGVDGRQFMTRTAYDGAICEEFRYEKVDVLEAKQ